MTKILTLMDNTPGAPGTAAEHGLSFWIERDGRAALFDTGKTGAFIDNSRLLGIDLGAAEAVVLSHGHYDHGGGVRALYERASFRGPFWCGGGVFEKKWALDPTGPRFNGLDFDAAYLDSRGVSRHEVAARSGETVYEEALPGVYVVNGFPRVHTSESANPRFVVERNGARVVDAFDDEVCIAVALDDGLALIAGCAHPGLMNMMAAVGAAFGRPIRAVFGGSHLVEADAARIDETIGCLRDEGCSLAALGHCTGPEGTAALLSRLGPYRPLSTGAEFIL